MATEEVQEKSHNFKAEIKQLLNILIHSLYKERDIFLRELVSNASDALTRLQFEMLTTSNVVDPEAELAIRLETKKGEEAAEGDAAANWLIITDTGLGMTAAEMRQNLGTIAQSGARDFLSKLGEKNGSSDSAKISEVIGQFGVGFYSVFMVAQEVRVISRSFKPQAKAAMWVSDGGESYRIEAADKSDRGTEIHIKLRPDAAEYADEWKLKQVIKKHSDFVGYPIYVGEDQVNQQESLWRKRPSDVSEEDYRNFYQQMTLDFEEPLTTIHFTSDAPLNLRALLFIPSKREPTMFSKRTEPGVMLYSRNVLIQEYCTDVLPKWLSFVDGVVDSEDLPLNVSRESVQNTRIMRQLEKTIRKRVLRELSKLAEDKEKYTKFWREFGRFFKEGLATDFAAREDIMPLLHFYSSKSNGELTSLDAYIERMPAQQEEIYFVMGDDLNSVSNSPHLDPFTARELEVLYFIDAFDAFMAPALMEYKGKKIRNIDDATLELPEAEGKETETAEDKVEVTEESFNALLDKVRDVLGERVTEVRASKVLKNSPVRLVSPDNQQNQTMNRIYRYLEQDYEVPKKILELNATHPLIANLAQLVSSDGNDTLVELTVEQLFDSALVQEGLHPNPAEMLPRIQQLLELATAKQ